MISISNIGECLMCLRKEMPLTFHHLIPRTLHSKKWYEKRYTSVELNNGIYVCEDCHEAIHQFIAEKDLGKSYNTLESLMVHPKVQKFAVWIGKQKSQRNKTVRANKR